MERLRFSCSTPPSNSFGLGFLVLEKPGLGTCDHSLIITTCDENLTVAQKGCR